jgi:hypothetical protein
VVPLRTNFASFKSAICLIKASIFCFSAEEPLCASRRRKVKHQQHSETQDRHFHRHFLNGPALLHGHNHKSQAITVRPSYFITWRIISRTWLVVRTRAMRGNILSMKAAIESSYELLQASRTMMML